MRGTRDDDDFEDRLEDRLAARAGSGSGVMDAIDLLGRRLGGAIAIAGALIGAGIYMSSGDDEEPQTYQAFAADGEVFRVNTDSGTIIACNAQRCFKVLERGQDLAEDAGNTLFKVPAAAQPPAQLPAPQPAAPAQPSATPAPQIK